MIVLSSCVLNSIPCYFLILQPTLPVLSPTLPTLPSPWASSCMLCVSSLFFSCPVLSSLLSFAFPSLAVATFTLYSFPELNFIGRRLLQLPNHALTHWRSHFLLYSPCQQFSIFLAIADILITTYHRHDHFVAFVTLITPFLKKFIFS